MSIRRVVPEAMEAYGVELGWNAVFDLAEALFRTDIFNPAVHENHQVLSPRIPMLMLWMEPGWEFPRSSPDDSPMQA